ncbi:type II 3-dehydroquinate dehydratase [Candidatus Pelagibacter sp.]|nr:type II 3-dehydroquinate dehydratase [Candidatus Pelagibacter sp.]
MSKKILIINGPNLNLLGEREQSQYGNITLEEINEKCVETGKKLNLHIKFKQSNIEGEIVNFIQNARNEFNGLIINAAGFTHTSVSIRDALDIFKNPIIEVHISNIYKREEFRQKSLISHVATGGIFGIGPECYNLAIHAINKLIISNGS